MQCTMWRLATWRYAVQENIRIQNNIHRRQVKHDTALFLRDKYKAILQTMRDVRYTLFYLY